MSQAGSAQAEVRAQAAAPPPPYVPVCPGVPQRHPLLALRWASQHLTG